MSNSKKFNSRKTEIVTVGKSKATSSKIDMNFHDLPYAGIVAAARRFFYGQHRHGRFNWTKGDKVFAEERIKHLINHIHLFNEERKQEDLDAIVCNSMMVADFYARNLVSKNPRKDFMYFGKENVQNK